MQRLRGIQLARQVCTDDPDDQSLRYMTWYYLFHVVFGIIAVLSIVFCWTDPEVTDRNAAFASACIVALIVWFFIAGRWENICDNRSIIVYFVVQLALLTAAIRFAPPAALNLFAAYWQGFGYFNLRPSIVWSAILTAAMQWAFGVWSFSDLSLSPGSLVVPALAVVVSGMMARYMELFSEEADKNAALLKELRSTQEQLIRTEREAGVQEERRRLAGEIHDTIAQHFASIVTNLEASEARMTTNPPAAIEHMRSARDAARHGITDARSMVQALQPNVLEGRTLAEALADVCETAGDTHGFAVSFEEQGDPAPLVRVHEAILVRALQESLTNVRKHAHASRAECALTWLDDEVILDISDNGRGFDLATMPFGVNGHHIGLATMRDRAERAGGDWTIESTPGEGTSLAVSFPLPTKTEQRDHA